MSGAQHTPEVSFADLRLHRRGKVRDVYEIDGGQLLLVATDRISAFDCILPTPIRRKGEVLTALSRFWFGRLEPIIPNHLLTTDVAQMPEVVAQHAYALSGRSMLVRRTAVFPVECVVRGYLAGSGWKDYQNTGEICGHRLPTGLRESDKLPEPIFTPATKAESGHDENISVERMREIVGESVTTTLRETSLALYRAAEACAHTRGIIIADTKFEFGLDQNNQILLIDEVLTPDSSRFWPAENYEGGHSQSSFDKQFVRDYLETLAWDKQPPAPPLPPEIAEATTARYLQAYRLLTGNEL
ncbi:MAG TPA: phosphoribosylaminoimidazolesuccinocarboxamide synthase [Pyrinomonadaceae bacterium]|nr:phosphoribosylaminoimidazolesuccinocarboxamide synthase [Pyrinomonadaceae bacterium]